jgi:hypothetical protein
MPNNIAITVGDEQLDLPADLSINFTLKNKLFFRTVVTGVNSYDINIPATERNKRLLGFRNVIEADASSDRTIASTLYLEGIKYTAGVLSIRGASHQKFRCSFRAFNDRIKQLEGVKLTDIALGTEFYQDDAVKQITEVNFKVKPGETAAVKIDGTVYSASFQDTPYQTILNLRDNINTAGLNNVVAGHLGFYATFKNSDWEETLTLAGYSVTDSFIVKTNIAQNTASYSNAFEASIPLRTRILHKLGSEADQAYPERLICWPTILNPQLYGDKTVLNDSRNEPPVHQRLINDYGITDQHASPGYLDAFNLNQHTYETGQFFDGAKASNNRLYLKPMSPCIFVVHLLERIFNHIGFTVAGSFVRDPEIRKLAIYTNIVVDELNLDGKFSPYKTANGWEIPLNDFAPDKDVIAFLKDLLLRYFNATVQINEASGQAIIEYANAQIAADDQLKVQRTHRHNIRLDQTDGFAFETAHPDDPFYEDRHEDKRQVLNKIIKSSYSQTNLLPTSNATQGDVRKVFNQNLYYIFNGNEWQPYSYDYYDYQPIKAQELESISPENSFIPVIQEKKAFVRPPFISLYFSQDGQKQHQVTIRGVSYTASSGNTFNALADLAQKINEGDDVVAALKFERVTTTNNRLPGLLVYIPKERDNYPEGFNWNIDLAANESDHIAPFGIFNTNPLTAEKTLDARVQFLMPAIEKQGISPNLTETKNGESTLRFLFYRGLHKSITPNGSTYEYPLGTPDLYDATGEEVGSYAIRWRGEKGLYQQFWQQYNSNLNNGKNTELELLMGIDQLINMDLATQIRNEGNLYWWKELQFQVNMQTGLQPVKGKLLKQH